MRKTTTILFILIALISFSSCAVFQRDLCKTKKTKYYKKKKRTYRYWKS